MGHYDSYYEAEYAEQRERRKAELAPLAAKGRDLLTELKCARVGERITDRIEEALFWLSQVTPT